MGCFRFVSFGVCLGLLVVLFVSGSARAEEMPLETVEDSGNLPEVLTDPGADTDDDQLQEVNARMIDNASNRQLASANSLSATSVTLDTVNNNVLSYRNLFGDAAFWWDNYPFVSDDGASFPMTISLRQWLMSDKLTRSNNGVDYEVTTLNGRVKKIDQQIPDIYRRASETNIAVYALSSQVDIVKSDVKDIKSRLGGSVEVSEISADESLRYLPSGSLPWIQSYLTPAIWGVAAGLLSFTLGHVWDSFVKLLGLARTR